MFEFVSILEKKIIYECLLEHRVDKQMKNDVLPPYLFGTTNIYQFYEVLSDLFKYLYILKIILFW